MIFSVHYTLSNNTLFIKDSGILSISKYFPEYALYNQLLINCY